ncbi:MAG: bifunctional oligoribonuclease/PAP phosphatase NrnA [Paludibacteraceae bacterium]|nr:bifunctional oligoribonuclease/PAP phosphatase NrnA [Paludibacteraceae bacterium]
MIENIGTACSLIGQSSNVIITGHVRPDGDAIGATLALRSYLLDLGKKATVILPNAYPDYYSWIPDIRSVVILENNQGKVMEIIKEADLLFCVDYNQLSRISALRPLVEPLKIPRIVIDHHIGPDIPCDFLYSVPSASAASELVYRFICELSGDEAVTHKIATQIMIGITTDTGGLAFSCNDPELYHIIGNLVAKGVDRNDLNIKLFHTYSLDRFKLMSHCLSKMEILADGRTALIVLTVKEQKKFRYQVGDTEGFVNMPLTIQKINRSILVREEEDGEVKVSLRSEGDNPVNTIAELFGGGGHKNASGFEAKLPLAEVIERLKRVIH